MANRRKTSTVLALIITIALARCVPASSDGSHAAQERAESDVAAVDGNTRASTTTNPDGRETSTDRRAMPSEELAQQRALRHEVLPGAGGPPSTTPTDPIGDLDDDRPVPAGFDFTAPVRAHYGAGGQSAASDLAVVPSCSHQCITKGVAYPRGFGVELVVETSVPAKLFITAIADTDDDGDYEESHVESTSFGLMSHSWALDHLVPGVTYHVMAAATDEHGHTAYVWGEFTTLSQRNVFVEFGPASVFGGPGGITSTTWLLGLDGPHSKVTPGDQGILLYNDVSRSIDIDFWMLRGWDDDLCESFSLERAPSPQGHHNDSCIAWNSAFRDDVDLDDAPAGETRWTQTSVDVLLHPPTGAGDALPSGFGDPYHFYFEVPMTLHVTYS